MENKFNRTTFPNGFRLDFRYKGKLIEIKVLDDDLSINVDYLEISKTWSFEDLKESFVNNSHPDKTDIQDDFENWCTEHLHNQVEQAKSDIDDKVEKVKHHRTTLSNIFTKLEQTLKDK